MGCHQGHGSGWRFDPDPGVNILPDPDQQPRVQSKFYIFGLSNKIVCHQGHGSGLRFDPDPEVKQYPAGSAVLGQFYILRIITFSVLVK